MILTSLYLPTFVNTIIDCMIVGTKFCLLQLLFYKFQELTCILVLSKNPLSRLEGLDIGERLISFLIPIYSFHYEKACLQKWLKILLLFTSKHEILVCKLKRRNCGSCIFAQLLFK